MLFALECDPARGEQYADEHQRDAHRDHNRIGVERRAFAMQQRAVNRDRLAHRREHVGGDAQVVRGKAREAGYACQCRPVLTLRLVGRNRLEGRWELA